MGARLDRVASPRDDSRRNLCTSSSGVLKPPSRLAELISGHRRSSEKLRLSPASKRKQSAEKIPTHEDLAGQVGDKRTDSVAQSLPSNQISPLIGFNKLESAQRLLSKGTLRLGASASTSKMVMFTPTRQPPADQHLMFKDANSKSAQHQPRFSHRLHKQISKSFANLNSFFASDEGKLFLEQPESASAAAQANDS